MTSAFWKLRRFGARALRVVQRHKAESTAIAAHEAKLAQLTKPFAAAYDELVRVRAATADAVRALHATVRAWLPLAQRDVAGIVSADFGGRPEVADDVIADAKELLELVKAAAAGALPYQAACASELARGIEAAGKAAAAAEAADARYAGLLRQLRQAAVYGRAAPPALSCCRRSRASAITSSATSGRPPNSAETSPWTSRCASGSHARTVACRERTASAVVARSRTTSS